MKMKSITRFVKNSGSVTVCAPSRKPTSYGVTSATKMSAVDVVRSHLLSQFDLRGSISQPLCLLGVMFDEATAIAVLTATAIWPDGEAIDAGAAGDGGSDNG